jgi:integrase/recombinase XerD
MFENWVTRSYDRVRLESSVLCAELLVFAEVLQSQDYPPRTLRRYLFAAEAFGRWIRRRRWLIQDIDERRLQRFLAGCHRQRCRGRGCGRFSTVVFGVRKFVEIMRTRGVMSGPCARSLTPNEKIVREFDAHLARTGNSVRGTRQIYTRYAYELLETRFGTEEPDFRLLDASCVSEFVRSKVAGLGQSSRRAPATATRAFLRFLIERGLIAEGLLGAIPSVRQYKQATLPRYLSSKQLTEVLAACRIATPTGRRNLAMVLMLARLAVRACEVASLRLNDIRWRQGVVVIHAAKSRRERTLPLPSDVGTAIVAYLRHGRPHCECPEVFLSVRAPHRPLTPAAVGTVVAQALRRTGVTLARPGAHILRHTAATQMVRAGASFKQVADVLGHARIETTTIYAKLDLETLARIALPWPEVQP